MKERPWTDLPKAEVVRKPFGFGVRNAFRGLRILKKLKKPLMALTVLGLIALAGYGAAVGVMAVKHARDVSFQRQIENFSATCMSYGSSRMSCDSGRLFEASTCTCSIESTVVSVLVLE